MADKIKFNIVDCYCCNDIKDIVAGTSDDVDELPVKYRAEFRDFVVMVCPKFEHTNKDRLFACPIQFCPWCGAQFPSSLVETYFEILQREFPHNDCDQVTCDYPPQEFRTDEWWRKRGL